MDTERTPLWKLSDEDLLAVSKGERDAEYGHDADRARSTARTILVNRAQQRTNPAAFTPTTS